jgi:hypothetical protein
VTGDDCRATVAQPKVFRLGAICPASRRSSARPRAAGRAPGWQAGLPSARLDKRRADGRRIPDPQAAVPRRPASCATRISNHELASRIGWLKPCAGASGERGVQPSR